MSLQQMIQHYDHGMFNEIATRFYEHSDFFNFGYWTPGTHSVRAACEALVDELLAFIPAKQGNILDVGCGVGASTRHLLKHYRPEDVYAINISDVQLARAKEIAPGCTFQNMDAADLKFPDSSFDNVISVEAAFHFDTRDDFFREAFRVLKPGGRLVHSDLLFRHPDSWFSRGSFFPPANFLTGPAHLKQRLERAGFENVTVRDATEQCWRGFCAAMRRWPRQERNASRLSLSLYLLGVVYSTLYRIAGNSLISYYTLSSAQKPPDGGAAPTSEAGR
jgi:cyclopropane fatty-acyl-phospholipid synthase-like methyltransferase